MFTEQKGESKNIKEYICKNEVKIKDNAQDESEGNGSTVDLNASQLSLFIGAMSFGFLQTSILACLVLYHSNSSIWEAQAGEWL